MKFLGILLLSASCFLAAGCANRVALTTPHEIPLPILEDGQVVLFVGDGCTRCETVTDRITKDGLDKKMNISIKEVFHNQDNALQLVAVTRQCAITLDKAGVPLLWDGQHCIQSDEKIIDFLNKNTVKKK
ncbi:MAG: hypothetical protein WC766_05300 [Patescibacteria group bacterium]|jgi:hypothetical protein